MRIGVIADNLDDQRVGGLRTYTLNLVTHLLEIDNQNQYFLIRNRAGNDFTLENAREIIVSRRGLNRFKEIRKGVVMPLTLRGYDLDIVHETYHFGPFLFPSPYKKILTVHDISPILRKEAHTAYSALRHRMLLRTILERAHRIIADSRQTMHDLASCFGVRKEKMQVIYLAASEMYKVISDESKLDETMSKYGLRRPFALYVGALEPRKNLPALIAAFSKIASSIPHQLVIVGKRGWGYEEIFQAVKRENLDHRIHFPGFMPDEDLPSIYNSADFFVFPSFYEGFGLPVLEAMHCGCPVITSNTSSLSEIAADAALLVDPYDTDMLADAMRELAGNKALMNDLADKGIERAKMFSWEKCARETLSVYRELGP